MKEMRPEIPQLKARIRFTFEEHGRERRRWFLFPEDRYRRVPMSLDGGDLQTVNMWSDSEGKFEAGDEVMVECTVIKPDLVRDSVCPGGRFRLWDGGYFAEGVVTEVFEE